MDVEMQWVNKAKCGCAPARAMALMLLLLTLWCGGVAAQCPQETTQGRDFWVTFLTNHDGSSTFSLIAAGDSAATITVVNPRTNWSTTATLAAHSYTSITIPSAQAGSSSGAVTTKGLHITSTATISLYASNFKNYTYDITTVLPTPTLRSHYIAQTYSAGSTRSEVGFVATEDTTVLTMTLPCSVDGLSVSQGNTYTVTMMAGQSLQLISSSNMGCFSGMEVTSNGKPFAMFQGNKCAQVPAGYGFCDHLYEQTIPVDYWGKDFVIVPTAVRTGGERVCVTASEGGCQLRLNGTLLTTLAARGTYEFHLPSGVAKRLTATKPVMVCLYLSGDQYGGLPGDPASVIIPPVEQGICNVTFRALSTSQTSYHYTNIVTATENVSTMTLDGNAISSNFVALDDTFSYAKLAVSGGVHTLANSNGTFVAHFYGLGSDESYAYVAGMGLRNLHQQLYIDSTETNLLNDTILICALDTVHFEFRTNSNDTSSLWYINGVLQNTDNRMTLDYKFPGDGNYQVMVLTHGLCETAWCDTLLVAVHVVSPYFDTTVAMPCEDSYTFYNQVYTQSGQYQHVIPVLNGCDSIHHLDLTLNPLTMTTVFDTIVENQLPYTYSGHIYSQGVVDDSVWLNTWLGCDSLIIYSLYVYPNVDTTLTRSECNDALPLQWNGVTFDTTVAATTTMTRMVTLPAHTGADSVVTMHLMVFPVHHITVDDTICDNQSIVFEGTSYNVAGPYTHHFVSHDGCDSVRTLQLVTLATSSGDTLVDACDSFTWYGVTYTTAGAVATRLTTNAVGCDSTTTLQLTLRHSTAWTHADTVIENNLPVTFCGVNFGNDVVDTMLHITNVAGCDSAITYSLHVWHNVTAEADSTLCENALPLLWNGVSFTTDDTVTMNLAGLGIHAMHGEDSTLTMCLHVLRNTVYTLHDTVIENNLPVTFCGVSFANDVVDTTLLVTNEAGCDSTITYSLHVWHNVTAEADSTLCENALPLLWNGVSFTTDDTVTRNLAVVGIHAMHGEDSTLTMRLHVLRNTAYTQQDTIIENNLPVAFCGVNFTTGVADTTFVIANTVGCDSVIHYSLHVWRNYHHTFDSMVCDNQLPMTWCGATFNADLSDYQQVDASTLRKAQTLEYTSVHGTDSMVTLLLTVHRTYEVDDATDICDGDTLWVTSSTGLLTLTTGGNYPVPLTTLHHCDSLVHLQLTVHPVYLTEWRDTICDNQETTFDGQTVVVGGHYEVNHQTTAGCDSTLKMDLVVWNTDFEYHRASICTGISYVWENGVEYFASTYEPTVTYPNQHGCDSTRQLILDIDTSFCALIQATPPTVSYEHHEVRLADVSGSDSRIWILPYITDTNQVTHYDYPMDEDSVEITLIAVNWMNCIDTATIMLRADRGILWPPNVFTPNESTNRVFFIPSYELASGEVWVYSRQGNIVAHFDALTGFWDGKKDGVLCPQASYMWVMKYSTKANPRQELKAKGSVTLLQ